MDFDPCQSGHDLFHLKNSYFFDENATGRYETQAVWLMARYFGDLGGGRLSDLARLCRVWCTSQRDRCFRLIPEEEIVYHNRHFYRV